MVRVLAIAALGAFALGAQAGELVTQTDLAAPDVSASERDDSPPAKAKPAPAPAPAAPKAPPAPATAADIKKSEPAPPKAKPPVVEKKAPKQPAKAQPKGKAVAAFWFILPGG